MKKAQDTYRAAHPDKVKARNLAFYAANSEREKTRAQQWRAENKDRVAAVSKASRDADPERYKARHRAWRAADPERTKARRRKNYAERREQELAKARSWKKANPERQAALNAKRMAAKKRAIPSWADLDRIAEFYAEAQRLTRETGVKHHVDHIVPLQSKPVCGLHVPSNLRAIPGDQNMSKSNRHWPGMTLMAEAA